MIHQKYEDVVTDELLKGNLDHDAYEGFLQDYRVLHCLLRKYKPRSLMETGTNTGMGMNVIAAAIPNAKLYSLDLDYLSMCRMSQQYPLGENLEDRVGSAATVEYTQLRGDSLTFDFSPYPVHAGFIDSEHDFIHPFREAVEILKHMPTIIIFHDADMEPVIQAVIAAKTYSENGKYYNLYRVTQTRIAYLLHNYV